MTTVREFASVSTLLVLFVFVFTFDVVCAIALVEKKRPPSYSSKKGYFHYSSGGRGYSSVKAFRSIQ